MTTSVRLSNEQFSILEEIARENGVSRAEQIRIAISKYLELCERVEQGNFIVTLPSIQTDELHLALSDLYDLKLYLKEVCVWIAQFLIWLKS